MFKTTIAAIALVAAIGGSAHAQTYTTNRLGNSLYTNGPDGTYTTNQLGNSFYTTGPNGYSATTNQLGNSLYTTVNPGFQPPTVFQPYGYR